MKEIKNVLKIEETNNGKTSKSMTKQEYIEDILNLPYEWQIDIITSVLARTLEPDPEIEQAWIDEVKRREKEIKAGTTKMISQEEFEQHLKKLRELYEEAKRGDS